MAAGRRAIFSYVARAVISATLLAMVASRVDWTALGGALAHARPLFLGLALITIWCAVSVRAYSFALVVNRPLRVITLGDAMRLTLAGNGAALVLPGPASDLLKANLAWREHGDPERMATSTVIDKVTSLAAIGLLATVFGMLEGRAGLALAGCAVLVVATVPLVAPRVVPWALVTRIVAPKVKIDAGLIKTATTRDGLLYAYVTAVSVGGWLLSFGAIALVAVALNVPVTYPAIIVAGSAMTLASLLPLSIGGLGIAQMGLVGALGWFAVDTKAAAGISLVHLALVLTPAIVGAIGYARPPRAGEPCVWRSRVSMLTSVYPRYVGDPTGSFVSALAKSLAAAGTDVSVFAPHAPGLEREEVLDGVRVRRFAYFPERLERLAYSEVGIPALLRMRPVTALALAPFLVGLARAARQGAHRADVVHAHWAPVALIATVSCPRCPVVVTLHGTDVALAERSAFWRAVTLSALRRVRLALCVSESLASRVRTLPRFPGTALAVVGNGIDPGLLSRPARSTTQDRTPVLFVGRLTADKGVFDLLSAFATLPGQTVLEYVGVGPEKNRIAEAAYRAGVDERVVLAGALDHEHALERISAAGLVVVPSRDEGFSLVALEAAALGVPCVGTRVGVLPELLHPQALVDPGDVAGLAAVMARVLADSAFSRSLVVHARTRAQAHTWPWIAGQTQAAYARACAGRG